VAVRVVNVTDCFNSYLWVLMASSRSSRTLASFREAIRIRCFPTGRDLPWQGQRPPSHFPFALGLKNENRRGLGGTGFFLPFK
jgi:hypothetical protein